MSEGIFILNNSKAPSAGIFELPPDFDKTKYAAQWVMKGGAVDSAKQPQPILGTNFGSDGWQVYVNPKGHKLAGRPVEVPTKNAAYILMYRPRDVQDKVNAIYGNVSKQHLIREQTGQTIAGQTVNDPGILTDERIRQGTGITEFGGEGLDVPMNPVRTGPRVEKSPEATVETE